MANKVNIIVPEPQNGSQSVIPLFNIQNYISASAIFSDKVAFPEYFLNPNLWRLSICNYI